MKKITFSLIMAFSLLTSFAQNNSSIFSDKEFCSFDLDISLIDLFEERTYVISRITEDPRFMITTGSEDGIFSITSSPDYENIDFYNDFSAFLDATRLEFSTLTKDDAAEIFYQDKSDLPEDFLTNLMLGTVKRDGNGLCSGAYPFCTDVGIYQFPAGVDTGSGEPGPCYKSGGSWKGTSPCLTTTPNPAWYYLRMDQPGNINIYMYSTPNHDIDFICWGPFDDYLAPCPNNGETLLTCDKVVSCSYSPNTTETCQIPSTAQTGEYYILLITNYSNQHCNITFSKTGGSGTTDCSILPPVIDHENPCYGGTMQLTAHEVGNASYSWTGPNGFTSTIREPYIDNVTFNNSGTYSCSISVPGQGTSDPMELEVEILPELHASFTVANAVPGAPAQFTGTETTSPAGYTDKITSWEWDFGDGSPEVYEANPTHVYTATGTYEVTYTIVAENESGGTCEDTKTITITVTNNLSSTITCSDENLCEGEQTTISVMPSGGTGNYTYTWTPAGLPATQSITVSPSETTTYTCVVSDGYNETTVQQTIAVYPDYSEPTYNDLGKSCQPYHVTEHLVFYESVDDDFNLGTIHGCDSVIHYKFIKYDEPVVPLINGVERKEVMAGSSWMPLQYKFSLENVTGAGIEQGEPLEYHWSIQYHVDWTGFDNTETWILNEDGTNEASLLVLSGGNATIHCDVVTICGTIRRSIFVYSNLYGIEDNEQSDFISVYPNPTSGSMYIKFDESINCESLTVCLYNAEGILVKTFKPNNLSDGTLEYSMDNLADGLYLIKITGKNINITKRLTLAK